MGILDWLGSLGGGARPARDDAPEIVRQVVDALDRMDPDRARRLALFSYLLGRVAHAEGGISDEETRRMEEIVVRHGGVPAEQAIVVVQMAKARNVLFGGTDNFLVAREFGALAAPDEKRALIDCLYAVSAADEVVSTREDNEIAMIAQEIGLDRRDVLAVKSRWRDRLGVLRRDASGEDERGQD